MSFLSYLSHPALVAASVGGVTLGVILLLFPAKSMMFGNFSSWGSSLGASEPSMLNKVTGDSQGNCRVVGNYKKVIEGLKLIDYVAISCESKGFHRNDDLGLPTKWTGLFPKKFFVGREKDLSIGRQLQITTDTKDQEIGKEIYITVFRSNSFSLGEEMIGTWDDGERDYGGKTVDFVKIVNFEVKEKIFLIRDSERRR